MGACVCPEEMERRDCETTFVKSEWPEKGRKMGWRFACDVQRRCSSVQWREGNQVCVVTKTERYLSDVGRGDGCAVCLYSGTVRASLDEFLSPRGG